MTKIQTGGIIIGERRSFAQAEEYARRMTRCPYLAVQFIKGAEVGAVFIVPEENRWWLEYPAISPRETGFERAEVLVGDRLFYPTQFRPRIPFLRTKTAPCGANCARCPNRYRCLRCPATVHFRPR